MKPVRAVITTALLCFVVTFSRAQTPITSSTVFNPASRTENTTFDYRIANSTTLAFLNSDRSLTNSGTDSGAVFSFNGSSLRSLSLSPNGALDADGFRTGSGTVVFQGNSAGKNGGAISIANNRVALTLVNTTFAQNRALGGNGGAIVTNGTSRIASAAFVSNSASVSGGAIYNTGSAWFTHVVFGSTSASEGNTSGSTGGAIYNSGAALAIASGTFASNSAGGNGGAIYNTGASSVVSLSDILFLQNKSSASSGAGGGAIYMASGTMRISHSLFEENRTSGTASSHGGAIYNNGASLALIDSAFTNNAAANLGGAIYSNKGTLDLTTNTSASFIGNKAGVGANGSGNAVAASGGFLNITGSGAVANFNINGSTTTLTIGATDAADRALDSISTSGNGVAASGVTINKNGNGTLVLNADNSAYKGAINVNEGSLLLGNNAAKLGASMIAVGDGVSDARFGGAGTVSGTIAVLAHASLIVSGSGSATDSALLNFGTSGTAIGVVSLFDGSQLSGSGTLVAKSISLGSGTVAVSIEGNKTLTLASALTGTAAFEKRDAGTIILTNSGTFNDFSGSVILAGGTLAISAGNQLGMTSNDIRFSDNAILRFSNTTTGTLTNSVSVVANAEGVIEVQTRTLFLTGGISGSGTLSKTGTGSLLIQRADQSAFSGVLCVAQGDLIFDSGTDFRLRGSVSVEAGAHFSGAGMISGNFSANENAVIRPNFETAVSAKTLTIGGCLEANSAIFVITLFSGTASDGFLTSDRIFADSVNTSGTHTLDVRGVSQTGTYNLGNLTALASSRVTIDGEEQRADFRYRASLDSLASQLLLTTEFDASRVLTWTGGGTMGALWSGDVAGQWSDSGSVSRFANGDRVVFDGVTDAAFSGNRSIMVSSTEGAVASDLIVSGSASYTFRGGKIRADASSVVSGVLSHASGRLLKSGAGALIFENEENIFLGGIVIDSGSVVFSRAEQLGDGGRGIAFTGDVLIRLSSSAARLTNTITIAQGKAATFDTGDGALSLSGTITGEGGLTKRGNGTLSLAAVSDYKGESFIASGTLRAAAANVFARESRFTLGAGAVMDLAGFSQTVGGLVNRGAVLLGAGNPSLSVAGDYAGGDGAELRFALRLSDSQPPQVSSLAISGSVSGKTVVRIEVADSRSATKRAALPDALAPLITSVGGGEGDVFALSSAQGNRVVVGAYDYLLQPNSPRGAHEWRLVLNDFSPEVPAISGLDAIALLSGRAALDSALSRLSDLRAIRFENTPHRFSVWADGIYRRDSVNRTIYSGASISQSGAQAGADFCLRNGSRESVFAMGVFADFSNAQMQLPSGISTDADIKGVGVYASFVSRTWFFDAVVRSSKSNDEAHTRNGRSAFDAEANSLGGVLQAGRSFATRSGWAIQPIVALGYETHSSDDAVDSFGRAYEVQDFTSLAARAGVVFERAYVFKNGPGHVLMPRVRVGAANEFKAESVVSVAGLSVVNDLGGLSAELEVGLVWRMGRRWSFSANAATHAGSAFDGYSIKVGACCAW